MLRRIDAYLDAVPRSVARTEEVGPFTLFVNEGDGWRYYARPRLGETTCTAADVARVRDRQRTLRQPEEIEWIADLSPDVGRSAEAAGLAVTRMPLMHLPPDAFRPAPVPEGASVAFATPDDDLTSLSAVAIVAFDAPGTAVGDAGPEAVGRVASGVPTGTTELWRERIANGLSVTAFATIDGTPVAVGTHQPVGEVTEIVGVGSLPACRHRGLGAAITSALVQDANRRGIGTIFLSAGDETIARVYARLGFRTVGQVGAAEPAAER
jgi:GNAT superfamily N-acetyltransferase